MEPLPDPLHDRAVKSVQPPPALPLKHSLLYPEGDTQQPDWKELRNHLQREGRVTREDCLDLIKQVTDIVSNEPNLLRLSDPITVVGDIHGQFYDFLKLLDVGGNPDSTQYLFLGDYVDRGSFSIEVLLLLFAIKLNHPTRVWLLRGNHECRQMTSFFNFRDECECKFDMTVYFAFMEAFDALPLAAVIDGKFLALHGGLSPDLKVLSQVGAVNRFQEPPRGGLFCDLLWADPLDEGKDDATRNPEDSFTPNDVRGCSFFFGYAAASTFLDRNGLLSVLRAHEAQLEGYKMHQTNQKTGFPTVITIFSAPNYCDVYNNKGAVLKFENNTLNIQQFNFSPHPYHLPNFMDVFTWSIPFVSEKVTEMLYGILNSSVNEEEDDDVDTVELPQEVINLMHAQLPGETRIRRPPGPPGSGGTNQLSKERADALRKKVQSVGRLMRVFKTIRQENELIVQLKGCTPGHRIPVGLLLQGREGLVNELDKFQKAKQIDLMNERRPDISSSSTSSSSPPSGPTAPPGQKKGGNNARSHDVTTSTPGGSSGSSSSSHASSSHASSTHASSGHAGSSNASSGNAGSSGTGSSSTSSGATREGSHLASTTSHSKGGSSSSLSSNKNSGGNNNSKR